MGCSRPGESGRKAACFHPLPNTLSPCFTPQSRRFRAPPCLLLTCAPAVILVQCLVVVSHNPTRPHPLGYFTPGAGSSALKEGQEAAQHLLAVAVAATEQYDPRSGAFRRLDTTEVCALWGLGFRGGS